MPLPNSIRRCITLLRIAFRDELPMPVKLRIVEGLEKNEGAWGTCSKGRKFFTLRLDKGLVDFDATVANIVLLHEFAHALAWEMDAEPYDHGSAWGVVHARVWRTWMLEGVDDT